MTELQLPEGVTYLNAYAAVTLQKALSEEGFAAYCAKRGLTREMVSQWAEWFASHKHALDIRELEVLEAKEKKLRRERARLEREIERKKKLLAKKEIMLKLRLEAVKIWGNREG